MSSLSSTFVEIEAPDTGSLLELARAGDAEAFGELCRAYETHLLRQAMTLCGNPCVAEDLAQDTLVEAWKSLRRFNGRCQFYTWLCAILFHRHRNSVRRKRPTPMAWLTGRDRDEFQDQIGQLADGDSLPDHVAELREQAALVLECLRTLPAKQQQVIYLRFYVDHSLEGIAAALDCSVGTVKSRLFRALDTLRGIEALNTQFVNLKVGSL